MKIKRFEWDDGNILHLALGHGIEPEEAEEVFAYAPIYQRTKRGHYAVFGRTEPGRLLVIIFEMKPDGNARIITGWDMNSAERSHYLSRRKSQS